MILTSLTQEMLLNKTWYLARSDKRESIVLYHMHMHTENKAAELHRSPFDFLLASI